MVGQLIRKKLGMKGDIQISDDEEPAAKGKSVKMADDLESHSPAQKTGKAAKSALKTDMRSAFDDGDYDVAGPARSKSRGQEDEEAAPVRSRARGGRSRSSGRHAVSQDARPRSRSVGPSSPRR